MQRSAPFSSGVMVKTTPSTAFIVTQPNRLLQFEIVTLDPPAQFGLIDHAIERDVGGQCGEPVVVRRCLRLTLLRPSADSSPTQSSSNGLTRSAWPSTDAKSAA